MINRIIKAFADWRTIWKVETLYLRNITKYPMTMMMKSKMTIIEWVIHIFTNTSRGERRRIRKGVHDVISNMRDAEKHLRKHGHNVLCEELTEAAQKGQKIIDRIDEDRPIPRDEMVKTLQVFWDTSHTLRDKVRRQIELLRQAANG